MLKKVKLFFVTMCLFLPLSSLAVTAKYNAYGIGLPLASGEMTLTEGSENLFETILETKGVLSLLVDARTVFTTKMNRNKITLSSMRSVSGKKIKTRTVSFEHQPEKVDYQTAVYQIMNQTPPKTTTKYIDDGKRVLKATFVYQGKKDLTLSTGIFSGTADYYTLQIDVISGKKSGWFFNRVKEGTDSALHLYFAPVKGKKMFVFGQFETLLFGPINIYLMDFKDEKLS